tara:strand:- start:6988 stop:7548 length:561 start_codon:yes stop_codon:yes gene_type:complete
MEEHLDKFRMYGLVPYNISPIQQGIQYGHALQEYNNFISAVRKNKELVEGTEDITKVEDLLNEFDEWRLLDKTFIILNGGTSSTMEEHLKSLKELDITYTYFREPDLNNMVSGIVFLVPKQVYKKSVYPDFKDWMIARNHTYHDLKGLDFEGLKEKYPEPYQEWLDLIGGEKNSLLKQFLNQFRLT